MSVHCLTTHHTSRRQSPPSHQHHHQQTHSSMFDPLSNYFNHPHSVHLTNSNPTRMPPICGLITPSSSSSPQNQPFLTNQLGGQSRVGGFPNIQIPLASKNALLAQAGNNNNNAVRNPKKRSRRAPTMLTTDTTNF
jgi:hypothetical protein